MVCKSYCNNWLNICPLFVIQSKMWKEWKKNKCQPNFWKEVCLDTMMIFVFTAKSFLKSFYFKMLFTRFILCLISTNVLNTMTIK